MGIKGTSINEVSPRDFIELAEDDCKATELLFKAKLHRLSLFHAQQCDEKAAKGLLLAWRNGIMNKVLRPIGREDLRKYYTHRWDKGFVNEISSFSESFVGMEPWAEAFLSGYQSDERTNDVVMNLFGSLNSVEVFLSGIGPISKDAKSTQKAFEGILKRNWTISREAVAKSFFGVDLSFRFQILLPLAFLSTILGPLEQLSRYPEMGYYDKGGAAVECQLPEILRCLKECVKFSRRLLDVSELYQRELSRS